MTRTVVTGGGGGSSSGGGVPSNNNWASGTFGTGLMQVYGVGSHTFTVPNGISSVRVRCWGAGGGGCGSSSSYAGGGGGGFAMKTITGLTAGTAITVTVGAGGQVFTSGGTTSFGSYVSATGGTSTNSSNSEQPGGSGSGGDVNYTGGSSQSTYACGGGVASMWGNGAHGSAAISALRVSGGAGGGQNTNSEGYGTTSIFMGSSFGTQALVGSGNATSTTSNNSGLWSMPISSIDMIGTGPGGGTGGGLGKNGGGGGQNVGGSFPGGGSGSGSSNRCVGGDGLLIVEW